MTYLIKGETGNWEIVVGLEVHAQVVSKSKLFSGSATKFGSAPNSQVSLVDAAMPGMLPVINKECVRQAVRTGLGLNAKVNLRSVFDRKNYFYADLPQGYQISQFKDPIIGEGTVEIDLKDGVFKQIGIERLHLEQDAGKSVHDLHPTKTYVDLNRSGVALMEIVSDPDIRSPEEAAAYVRKLRAIMRYIGTCDGNMDEGSLRCDVNVSVRKPNAEYGTRCEIKNLNSIKNIMASIEYEAVRQVEVIEDGGKIRQETRLWDTAKNITRSMRSKEEAHDYRYFPDPDLLPLEFSADWVEELKETLPELPDPKKHRFMDDFGLSAYDAAVLVAEQKNAAYFEAVATGNDAKKAANWVTTELFGALNKAGKTIDESPITAENLAGLLELIEDGSISGRIAKDVFAEAFETGKDMAKIIEEKGLKQVSDTGALEKLVEEAISENPAQVEEFKAGKEKLIGFFVGQVMKKSKGQANPGMVNKILVEKLKG